MNIFHASDLHYCTKHLKIVDRAFSAAVDHAIETEAECAVISGDSFDSAINVHEPAVTALIRQIQRLADKMPVLILQGTFSHDRPGSLNVLGAMFTLFPIHIADQAEQIKLVINDMNPLECEWLPISEERFGFSDAAIFNCLPSLNKAEPEIVKIGAAKYVQALMNKWAFENATANVPTILVSHGTVNGCVTESKHAMISPDHEFSSDVLFSSECNAIMLGHIHKHQSWKNGVQTIAYPGSITRLVFGHNDPVGFLIWKVSTEATFVEFVPTPAPRLIDITFDGAPDVDELLAHAENVDEGDHVRIRYSIDQDFAHTVDKEQIRNIFHHVDVLKIEGTINAVQSVRAKGIGTAMTIDEKLGYWAVTTGDEDRLDDLSERLEQLRTMDPDQIVAGLLKSNEVIDEQEAA